MKQNNFKRNLLASAIASCVALTASGLTVAEENISSDDEVEEVVVTGIRGSLMQGMDTKRDAQGVVDSISAEDMGKFPDTNLAESLQRITGVSIDRNNGEGSKVTIRGLGPDFNLVTLNGRQMPASGLHATALNASRSFDFSNIASEAIAGVDVYKTSRADIPTGGMGGTINIRTTRPLEAPGLHFSLGGKAVYDESRLDAEASPDISGIYSQTFADDTIGVALSLSSSERKGGYRQVSVPNGWHTRTVRNNMALSTGEITIDDKFLRPRNIEYNFTEFERDRTNGQLTLQFAPTDRLTATLDYTYSEQEIATTQSTMNMWFELDTYLDEVDSEWALGSADNAGGNVYYPVVFNVIGGEDLVFGTADFAQVNENDSVGLNVDFNVSDNLYMELDYHKSGATSKAASPYGNSSTIQVAAYARAGTIIDFGQDFAVTGAVAPGGGFVDPANVGADILQPTGSSLRNSIFSNDIEQLRLSGNYTFDDEIIQSIDFGFTSTDNSIHRGMMVAQRETWAKGDSDPSKLRDDIVEAGSILSDFDSLNGTGDLANGAGTFDQFDLYYLFGFADVAADVVADQAPDNSDNEVDPAIWPCADKFCVTDEWTTDQRTEEITSSAYVQANFEMDLDLGVFKATTGLRYEETDVKSSAVVPAYTGVDWTSPTAIALIDTGEFTTTLYKSDYNYFLPNIDMSLELDNDVVLRASASKTIARANYGDISGGVTFGTVAKDGGNADRGDPTLLPHESTNLDISAEWYFDEASYVALGYFQKDVKNFVGSTSTVENLFGLRNPSKGPRAIAAALAITDAAFADAFALDNTLVREEFTTDITSQAVRDYIIANNPESVTDERIHALDEDPLFDFTVGLPINEDSARIDGLEFAVQHTLESGFGGQFNYTWVNSNREYDVTEFTDQFAVAGLSNTMNLVAFYENDTLSARLAYNWRDDFLVNEDREHGNPEFVEAYSQWDMNVSYNATEQLSMFVEGINITNETTRSYSRYKGALQSATETGARYQLGVRYTF